MHGFKWNCYFKEIPLETILISTQLLKIQIMSQKILTIFSTFSMKLHGCFQEIANYKPKNEVLPINLDFTITKILEDIESYIIILIISRFIAHPII